MSIIHVVHFGSVLGRGSKRGSRALAPTAFWHTLLMLRREATVAPAINLTACLAVALRNTLLFRYSPLPPSNASGTLAARPCDPTTV